MEQIDAYLPWIIVPALALALLSQIFVQAVYSRQSQIAAKLSGYAAARQVLDGSGLYKVQIEQVPGQLSNHYDARRKILQLSPDVYHGRNLAAVGIAVHEAGHAMQDAERYGLGWLRDVAIPAASFGSGAGILLAVAGLIVRFPLFLALGVIIFSGVVYFQVLAVPVELNASVRARRMLETLEIVEINNLPRVRWVLSAAALTYVGATLQSILTLFQSVASHFVKERERP